MNFITLNIRRTFSTARSLNDTTAALYCDSLIVTRLIVTTMNGCIYDR